MPLTAHDAAAGRFLILDMLRYKYPPVWVRAEDLFNAANTNKRDSDNGSETRVVSWLFPGGSHSFPD
ncbi:MAG: hypothetical protein J2P49_01675 [Methylocapsa sp.]|nr:hypothetical protein [Methylocapsa sp.]